MFLYIRPFVCKSIPTACFVRRHFLWSPITKAKYSKRLHKMKFAWKCYVYLCQPYTWSHHFESSTVATTTWLTAMEYLCYKWHRYVPFVVITIRSFPHSWFITGILTRVAQRVPHVEHELLTLPEHMSFSGVRVARFLVFSVMLCRSLFVLLSFFHLVIVLSVLLRFTTSDYITTLVSLLEH
jgi:hypothetical protein